MATRWAKNNNKKMKKKLMKSSYQQRFMPSTKTIKHLVNKMKPLQILQSIIKVIKHKRKKNNQKLRTKMKKNTEKTELGLKLKMLILRLSKIHFKKTLKHFINMRKSTKTLIYRLIMLILRSKKQNLRKVMLAANTLITQQKVTIMTTVMTVSQKKMKTSKLSC